MDGSVYVPNAYWASDVLPGTGGLPRALHGLAARSPLTFLRRAGEVAWEVGSSAVLDRIAPASRTVLEVAPGRAQATGRSLALYLHWSPDGRVSAMVRRQLALWRACGFDVIFISNSSPPAPDWDAVAEDAALRIRRTNAGRDFGAWRDGAALAVQRFGRPEELLLANDSVLGPFLPLEPVTRAWRQGGEGLFGLTDSLGGGAHLQSFAVLARGDAVVGQMLAHLAAFRDTRSKWRVVQEGEIGLTRRIHAAGLRCAALFAYRRLSTLVDDATRASLGPRFRDPDAFLRYPLNPCHHLWRVLVERMGFPYLKTELIRHNPGRLPGVEDWQDVVPQEHLGMIRAHLAALDGR